MSSRNHTFAVEEYYHCYNRGTEKRTIFLDKQDFAYFLESMKAYNSIEVLGKLRLHKNLMPEQEIVDVLSYCLLPNHFHIVLKEKVENGISNFMQRVGGGYTMYFNQKYERSGVLFQGVFKSKHIETDQDLRQVLAYVTHNNVIHNIIDPDLYRSKLNKNVEIVRGFTSNLENSANMLEIAEIIKLQRLSFD